MHLLGLDAQEQRIQARDHQALDVVRVAVAQGLADGVAQAGHLDVAGPVKRGQISGGAQRVALLIFRHLRPVNAAHVFAPAQNLADKAFDRRQRRGACAVGGLGGGHHFARAQQLEVHGAGQVRVVEPHVAFPHRVLVFAKKWQALLDKGVQRQQRLRARDRPAKFGHAAGVAGKARVDQRNNGLRGGVGRKSRGRRHRAGAFGAKRRAVVGVKVPLAAHGRFAVHQDAGFLAQFAVPVFQAQLLAALGVGGKVAHGAEEMQVVAHVHRHLGRKRCAAQVLQHAPVAGRGHHQGLGQVSGNRLGQFTSQSAAVVRRIQGNVMQRPTFSAQFSGKVAHGAQKHGGALLGGPDVFGLLRHFGHPQQVLRWVEAFQGGSADVELVAEHEHEVADWCAGGGAWVGRDRSVGGLHGSCASGV